LYEKLPLLRKKLNGKPRRVQPRAEREAFTDPEATLLALNSSRAGLIESEAASRLEVQGPNEVAHERLPAWYLQLLTSFNNPFIIILVVLAVVSFATGDKRAFFVILTMVGLSVCLRFWQEYRSEQAAEKLKAMVTTRATVLRRSDESPDQPPLKREVPIQELVPGDIVQLAAGDMIPADVRLLSSRDLFVSQAILSGESIPVEKYDTLSSVVGKSTDGTNDANAAKSSAPSAPQIGTLDLSNICYMGTNVVSGLATAVVVATGADTYFGSLAKSIVGQRAMTSFDRGVNSVSWVLIRFMGVMVPVVLLLNGFTKGDWVQAFFFAVSVAVGLTPEMLPMIVSANLAKGALIMSRNKVVVKRLNAIQNFGAMDVLCTDKTGTLTQDKIILERHLDVHGNEDVAVLRLAYLNSLHQTGLRNLLDVAVLRYAAESTVLSELSVFRKIDEIPFDFARRRMSVIVEDDVKRLIVCKGAVEEILAISTHAMSKGEIVPLDASIRKKIKTLTRELNEDGFRVLAVATKELPINHAGSQYAVADESKLVLHGYLAFLDPPKETARTAIEALRQNGVKTKILTGDNTVVTLKICREVGLQAVEAVLGRDIENLNDAELCNLVERVTVFAKMSPLQKARVIQALQKNGHTVGFLGDGINDAPALRDADIGISVDSAADIAKESADIILLEKSLLVLEQGIIEGRKTFGNIIKYVKMTASSNFGNVFSVLGASALLPFLPMLPIHLLIQNMLYDISQTAIPFDSVDREYLGKPRKWLANDIARFMMVLGPISSIFDYTTFALMWFVFGANTPAHQALFQSGWFVEGLLSQTLVVHAIRTQKIPFLQSRPALPMLLMTVGIGAAGIYLPFSPLAATIGLTPLPLAYFGWLSATLVCYFLLTQVVKAWYMRRFGAWL
jgi:Mg2+-importing ATPase